MCVCVIYIYIHLHYTCMYIGRWIGLLNCKGENRLWDYLYFFVELFVRFALYPHCTRLHDLLYVLADYASHIS